MSVSISISIVLIVLILIGILTNKFVDMVEDGDFEGFATPAAVFVCMVILHTLIGVSK